MSGDLEGRRERRSAGRCCAGADQCSEFKDQRCSPSRRRARRRAGGADQARSRNEIGALHGIPMTIKDSLDTAGVASTGGTVGPEFRSRAGCHSGLNCCRLVRLLGKTNTSDEHCPIKPTTPSMAGLAILTIRTSGGSSGGSGGHRGDWSSVFRHRQRHGRKPAHPRPLLRRHDARAHRGQVGPGISFRFGGYLDRLTTIGPIARFVGDLGFLLPLIAGPDSRDPAAVPVPVGWANAVVLVICASHFILKTARCHLTLDG